MGMSLDEINNNDMAEHSMSYIYGDEDAEHHKLPQYATPVQSPASKADSDGNGYGKDGVFTVEENATLSPVIDTDLIEEAFESSNPMQDTPSTLGTTHINGHYSGTRITITATYFDAAIDHVEQTQLTVNHDHSG